MKTIVISGAHSNIGKTTLANAISNILSKSEVVKIGTSSKKENKSSNYFSMETSYSEIKKIYNKSKYLIIESNSILNELTPDLLIYLPGESPKPSAEKASTVADIRRMEFVGDSKQLELSERLDITISEFKKIVWLSGARPEKTTAIIMTGGKSSRMGQDKASLKIDGETMLERAVNKLRLGFDEIIISTGSNNNNYNIPETKTVCDKISEQGPMMGLYSSLLESNNRINFIVACDIPNIDMSYMFRLLAASVDYEISVPSFDSGKYEPLFAMYKKDVITEIEKLLDKKNRRMSALIDACKTEVVSDKKYAGYFNLNTPEDLSEFKGKGIK